jgi:hypothetical protein
VKEGQEKRKRVREVNQLNSKIKVLPCIPTGIRERIEKRERFYDPLTEGQRSYETTFSDVRSDSSRRAVRKFWWSCKLKRSSLTC